MKKKIVWLVMSCLVVVALVVTSCGPAAEEEEEEVVAEEEEEEVVAEEEEEAVVEEEEEEAVVEEEEEEVVEEEEEAEVPQYGGTINLVQGISPPGFDPALTIWSVDRFILLSYEKPLMGGIDEYGPRGENLFHFGINDNSPLDYAVAHLVESWEFPDPTRLIYHVRQGVHFQNKPPVYGREMDAEDMALSLQRIWEVPRFKTGYWKFVASIEATDKYTVEIGLSEYSAMWKWMLGYGWYTDITPRELVEQDLINNWKYVCGTGPFILTDYVDDVAVTYERNPDYWATTTIDGKEYELPFADKVLHIIIPDTPTSVAAFRTGKLDVAFLWGAYDIMPVLEDNPEIKHKTFNRITANVVHMRCDMPPTNDINVRRALNMAIDREEAVEKLYFGDGTPFFHPLMMPDYPQYVPLDEWPPEIRELYEYHPDKARQLLTDAGYPDGFTIDLMVASWAIGVDQAAFVAAQLEKIGVTVNIDVVEPGVFYATFYAGNQPQMMLIGRGGMHLSEAQAHCRESVWNISMWRDPVFVEYLEAGLLATDLAERDEYIKKMYMRFTSESQELMLGSSFAHTGWWPWIKNYYGELDVGYSWYGPTVARMWLDQELKEEMGY